MTYEKFIELITAAGVEDDDGFLSAWWIVGGMEGGDCWGADPFPTAAESEPEFHELDKALLAVAPNLSMLQYKAILRDLVHRTFRQIDEYYGNFENRAYKKVSLRELHAWLEKAVPHA